MDAERREQAGSLFYSAYGDFERDVLAQVRRETYGEDIGQFSWITADELRGFFDLLELGAGSEVLDVACGSGGPAIFMAQTTGCRVTGIDINESGIHTARQMASSRGLGERARFEHIDAGRPLPFEEGTFDAIVCIDAMNHLWDRAEVMADWYRVLKPGGRFLFTDAVIVTGMLLRDEIMARSSSMGQFIFTPPGVHERFIEGAGFADVQVDDVTATIAQVARNWHDARERRREDLLKLETQADFDNLQRMLWAAHTLANEGRLSRFAYSAKRKT